MKRYMPHPTDYAWESTPMAEDDNGEFVKFEDYTELRLAIMQFMGIDSKSIAKGGLECDSLGMFDLLTTGEDWNKVLEIIEDGADK